MIRGDGLEEEADPRYEAHARMFRKLGQGGAVAESISPFTMEVRVMFWTLYCILLNEEHTPLA